MMTTEQVICELQQDIALYDSDIVRLPTSVGTPDRNLIDALEIAVECVKNAECYKWHDLLTNPNDLPTDMDNVLVCYIGGDNNWYETMFWDASRRVFSLYSFTEFEKTRKIAKNETDFGSVIAWKEIEPFEVDE